MTKTTRRAPRQRATAPQAVPVERETSLGNNAAQTRAPAATTDPGGFTMDDDIDNDVPDYAREGLVLDDREIAEPVFRVDADGQVKARRTKSARPLGHRRLAKATP